MVACLGSGISANVGFRINSEPRVHAREASNRNDGGPDCKLQEACLLLPIEASENSEKGLDMGVLEPMTASHLHHSN